METGREKSMRTGEEVLSGTGMDILLVSADGKSRRNVSVEELPQGVYDVKITDPQRDVWGIMNYGVTNKRLVQLVGETREQNPHYVIHVEERK